MKHARRWSMILLLSLIATLTAVVIAQAQDAASVGIGDTVNGTLDEDTPRALYELDLDSGADVTITLESTEFDAYLLLLDSADDIVAEDDDSAGRLNSQIETTLDAGTYTIIATSLREYRTEGELFASGDFTLTIEGEVQATPTPLPPSATSTGSVALTATQIVMNATQAAEEALSETPPPSSTPLPTNTPMPTQAVQRELSIGDSVEGTLSEDNPTDEYVLPLQAGDTVTITLVSEDFDTFVILNAPNGIDVARDDDSAGDLDSQITDFTVSTGGDYTVIVTSFGEANDLPAGFGDYTLTIEEGASVVEATLPPNPTARPEEIDPGAVTVAMGPVTSGDVIESTLTDDELAHEYTFEAVEGQIITVDLQADFDTYLTMFDSEGNVVTLNDDGGEGLNSRIESFVIPATGEYTIQASSYGFVRGFTPGTGDYTLEVSSGSVAMAQTPMPTPITATPTVAVTPTSTPGGAEVPETGVPVGDVMPGESVTGTLSEDEPAHGYTLDLNNSQSLTIDLQADFDTYLRVFDDTGALVVENDDGGEGLNSRIESFVFEPGSYTVNVSSFGFVRGFTPGYGDYDLTVEAGDDVVQAATPTMTMTPTPGDVTTTPGDATTTPGDATTTPGDATTTPAPGDANDVVVDMGFISIGESVTGTLSDTEAVHEYTFTGMAGEVVTITLTSDTLDTWVFLFDAETEELLIDNDDAENIELGLDSQIVGYELPFSGDYTIGVTTYGFVQGFESETGDYTLSIETGDVPPVVQATPTLAPTITTTPPPTDVVEFAGTISYGETVTNELTDDALAQEYAFSATAGDLVTIDLQSEVIDTYLTLFDENGFEVAFDDDGGDGLNSRLENFEIPATGQYRIQASSFGFVRGFTPDTGEYTLTLTSESSEFVSDPTEIVIGDTVVEELTSDKVVEEYALFAEAGDLITITLISEEFDTYLLLFDEDRNEINRDDDSAGNLDSRIGPFEIPADGIYIIQVNSFSNVTRSEFSGGAYTLSVDVTEPQPIEYTQSVEGEINQDNQVELYEFSGEQGDIVTVELDTTNPSLYARLTGADGTVSAEAFNGGIAGPVALPEDGTYLITVGSYNVFEPGSYTLTLDRIEPVEIVYGDEIDTNFDDDRALYYSFEGEIGDIIDISVDSDESVDTRIRVIGPGGFEIIRDDDGGAGFDPELLNFRLFEDGMYTLIVEPYIAGDNGDITVSLISSSLTAIDEEAQIIRLSDKLPFAVASFEAEAGETFLLSARVLVLPQGEPRITIRQGDEVLASNSVGRVSRLLLEFTTEDAGEIIIEVDGGGGTGAILEIGIEPVTDE